MSNRAIANVAAIVLLLLIGWRQFGDGVGPSPIPVPPPIPIPIPTPVVDPKPGSWIIIVEERSERSDIVAEMLSDADFMASISARRLKFRLYDQDDPDGRSFREATGGMPRPTLLIVDPSGIVLAMEAMPETMEAIDGAIKEATGL